MKTRFHGRIPLILPFISDAFAIDVNRVVKRSQPPTCLVFQAPPSLRRALDQVGATVVKASVVYCQLA
ncbi:hypothetical protein ANCCAN_29851 [Ancylostoma caninum]|uniref:Uncharacterized protein n=1 Tax=Ancylostoma caninum TaxID=29170 RepID=A0A368EXF2_ANCCA|nr:hypothetical protein ANCCAN_29851 [Ancylostoma caninum]